MLFDILEEGVFVLVDNFLELIRVLMFIENIVLEVVVFSIEG